MHLNMEEGKKEHAPGYYYRTESESFKGVCQGCLKIASFTASDERQQVMKTMQELGQLL
jgi:hypothetical protein